MKIRIITIIFLFLFSNFSFSSKLPELIPYRKGKKWGYCNAEKKIIIQPKYDDAGIFYNGLAWVKKQNKFGFIDNKGNLIIPFKYTWVSDFYSQEKTTVRIKKETFEIDKAGNKIKKNVIMRCGGSDMYFSDLSCLNKLSLDLITDYILALPDISIAVTNFPDEAKLFVPKDVLKNRTSKLLKQSQKKWATNGCSTSHDTLFPIYDGIKELQGNNYLVMEKKHFGIINGKNQITVPIIYDSISEIHLNLYLARQNYQWGMISNKNEVIIPFIYDEIKKLYEGAFLVKQNRHLGIINEENQPSLPIIYNDIIELYSYASTGERVKLYWVKLSEHWGIVDSQNNIVLPIIYDEIRTPHIEGYYTNSLYIIKLNNHYGYHDIMGKIIISIKYVDVTEFRGNLARVKISKNKYGYIDRKGVEYFED